MCSRDTPALLPTQELHFAPCQRSLLCPMQVNKPMSRALEFSLTIKLSCCLGSCFSLNYLHWLLGIHAGSEQQACPCFSGITTLWMSTLRYCVVVQEDATPCASPACLWPSLHSQSPSTGLPWPLSCATHHNLPLCALFHSFLQLSQLENFLATCRVCPVSAFSVPRLSQILTHWKGMVSLLKCLCPVHASYSCSFTFKLEWSMEII